MLDNKILLNIVKGIEAVVILATISIIGTLIKPLATSSRYLSAVNISKLILY